MEGSKNWLQGQDLRRERIYKYVRVGDELRFTLSCYGGLRHADLVELGEQATSAGTIIVAQREWYYADRYSMTLEIGWAGEEDDTLISEALGMPYRGTAA